MMTLALPDWPKCSSLSNPIIFSSTNVSGMDKKIETAVRITVLRLTIEYLKRPLTRLLCVRESGSVSFELFTLCVCVVEEPGLPLRTPPSSHPAFVSKQSCAVGLLNGCCRVYIRPEALPAAEGS